MPGQATGYTVSFTRVEVWNQELELTLGFGSVFDDLMDQTRPWVTQEYLFRGNELNKLWQYSGCWFQNKNNNNWESGGDAIVTLLRFAFHEMNLNRVWLHVFEFNERARASYKKCGFREEGRLRQHYYAEGRYWDVFVMAILRDEFEALHGGSQEQAS
ncbi:MAG: GNAT family N-acetyltransferase [Chloroflexi bacterium]|nr:GNAT family N-acetyltransferase [Chloroflexota bacterium]